LHGAVEFVQAARQAGVKPILGAEVRIDDGAGAWERGAWERGSVKGGAMVRRSDAPTLHAPRSLLLYVESAQGWHHLCRLLARHAELTANGAWSVERGAWSVKGGALQGSDAPTLRRSDTSVAAQQRCPFRREEFDGLTDGLIAVSQDTGLAEMFPGRFYGMVTEAEGVERGEIGRAHV